MNKRGEKLFSIWWFIIVAIVGLGIVTGVTYFYSSNFDVRSLEADVLSSKVIKCVAKPVGINPLIIEKEKDFNLYTECGISQSVLENGKYFVKIEVKDFFDGSSVGEAKKFGNSAFEKECEIKNKITASNYPECSPKSVYVIDKDNNKYLVSVLAASNYRGGKVNE